MSNAEDKKGDTGVVIDDAWFEDKISLMLMETVWLTCDDCHEIFEVEYGIALSLWQCQEEAGDPILCHICMPQDPYEEEYDD